MVATDIKTSVYVKLSTTSTITDLVGTRIYPGWAPPSVIMPYITFDRIDLQAFAPTMANAGAVDLTTLQFDIWGTSNGQVDAIVAALRTLLDSFTGAMSPAFICSWRFTSALDGPLSPSDGGADATARTTLTAELTYS